MKNIFFCGLLSLALIFSACDKEPMYQIEEEIEKEVVENNPENENLPIQPQSEFLLKSLEGEYTVYSDGVSAVIIDNRLVYITRFKLIDDFGNTLYAYCADMNSPCYDGARYKLVSARDYFKNGEEKKIIAALTYIINEYGWMETANPYGYRQLIQSVMWMIIHEYEITLVDNIEGEIIKDVINHIYNNLDEITNNYNTGVIMKGEGVEGGNGYGPYKVSENALLTDVVFNLTFDQGGNYAKFVTETGVEITQVKPGEPFYVKVSDGAFGEFKFTATASITKELWYVNDFMFFIDARDNAFPYLYQPLFMPLFQPLMSSDASTYFYSCSGSFTITSTEPKPEPKPDPEKITITGLNWNNGNGNGNGGGINQFTVNGITLKNNKNYVTPANFDETVTKTPGRNDETAIYTVTERTVISANGNYAKVYDIKVAFYNDGAWKGYGGTITVDTTGGNNKNQQVDLERIF